MSRWTTKVTPTNQPTKLTTTTPVAIQQIENNNKLIVSSLVELKPTRQAAQARDVSWFARGKTVQIYANERFAAALPLIGLMKHTAQTYIHKINEWYFNRTLPKQVCLYVYVCGETTRPELER